MLGMRYPISVWFLDQSGKILTILDELRPYKISPHCKDAASVLEFPVDWAKLTATHIGDIINWKPSSDDNQVQPGGIS